MPEYFPKRVVSRMPGFTLHGRLSHRRRALWLLNKVTFSTGLRHLLGRPAVRGWKWEHECSNTFLREQFDFALSLGSIVEGRQFLDSLTFNPMETPTWKDARRIQASPLGIGISLAMQSPAE